MVHDSVLYDFDWLGHFQLGDWLPILLRTLDSDDVPTAPTAAPTIKIFNGSDTLIETISLPVSKAKEWITGLFEHRRLLDATYAVGKYYFAFQWAISGTSYTRLGAFDIVAGGDADGSVIGMTWYDLPEAKNVVMQLDGGKIQSGRNPR